MCLYQKWATSKNLLWIDRDRMTKNSGVVLPSKSKLIHNTIGFIIPYFVLMVKPCEQSHDRSIANVNVPQLKKI